MKVFNLLLAVLFLVSAGLQFNDPDPLFWIFVYGALAVICGFAAFSKYNRWAILAVMAVCVFELSKLFPDFRAWLSEGMPSITESMKASSPHVELVREFLGIVICLVVLIFQYVRYRMIQLRAD